MPKLRGVALGGLPNHLSPAGSGAGGSAESAWRSSVRGGQPALRALYGVEPRQHKESRRRSLPRAGSKCSSTFDQFTPLDCHPPSPTGRLEYLPVSWLADWEVRQEQLLRQHQENTRQLVHSLRKDMLKRFTEGKSAKGLATLLAPLDGPSVELNRSESVPSLNLNRNSHTAGGADLFRKTESMMTEGGSGWPSISAALPRLPRPHEVLHNVSGEILPKRKGTERKGTGDLSIPPVLDSGPAYNLSPTNWVSRKQSAQRPHHNCIRAIVYDLVHSRLFSFLAASNVALYTVAVGVMADLEMRHAVADSDVPPFIWYVDLAFAVSFAAEVFLRVVSDGAIFFSGPSRNWNYFDLVVAFVGLADLANFVDTHLGFIRILRACRALRVIRVLRQFSALKELRMMAESICSCISSLVWATLLLCAVQYIFAVVLLRGASDRVRAGTLNQGSAQMLRDHFGSLAAGFFSLTEAVSGGRSWGEYAAPFKEVNVIYGACFPLYVLFVVFGAVNILTGIFVESTSCIANYDKELAVEEELTRFQSAINQIRDFFEELDTDGSGTLSFEELENCLSDERVRAYFSVLQMDVYDPRSLFQLLDKDNTGDVSIDEFIEECLRLKGSAKALDMAAVMHESRTTRQQLKSLMKAFETRLDEVCSRLHLEMHGGEPLSAEPYTPLTATSEGPGPGGQ